MELIHGGDQANVVSVLGFAILAARSPPGPIRCRLRLGEPVIYHGFDLRVRYGTQGLVCTLWDVVQT